MSPPSGNAAPKPARLADKKTSTKEVDPALLRITVTALCEIALAAGAPIRRKDARAYVLGRVARGKNPVEILRGARNEWGIVDETGETAAMRVDRARGSVGGRRGS